jgi:hypothetical protein
MQNLVHPRSVCLAVYSLEEVIPYLQTGRDIKLKDIPFKIKTNSVRLRTFLKGLKCVSCGIEGLYFTANAAIQGDRTAHYLALMGVDSQLNEVDLTSDHIRPLSRGGPNGLINR